MNQLTTIIRAILLPASAASLVLAAAAAGCSTTADDKPSPPGNDGGEIDSGTPPTTDAGKTDSGDGVPGATLVDCLAKPNENDVKCTAPQAGTVGSGPKFTGGLTTAVNHGFIAGNQLILAVEFTGTDDEYGGIFGIDLTTGDRTLLSGKYSDPVNGEVSKGTGPDGKSLNQVRDVAPGPNNTWYALAAKSTQSNRTIYSIDPSTGDRTVIFDAASTACEGHSAANGISFDYLTGLTVGSDGVVYVGLNHLPQGSGKGIAKVTPDGKCSVVTLSGAQNSADNKGTGPNVIGSFLYNVTLRNNSLYLLQFNTHPSIISVDPTTGNRTMISVNPDKGTGPELATDSMAIAPDGTFWTYHAYRNGVYGLVSVDPATGNRTASEPKGGPAKRAQGPDRGIWVHPNGKNLLFQYGNAILIYDPANGNSNTLSY